MGDSDIEWTDKTWPITVGCERTAPKGSKQSGCGDASGGGCYAELSVAQVNRCQLGAGRPAPYADLIKLVKRGDKTVPRWTGTARFFADRLAQPLRWRKPARIFVSSQSDLFHKDITNEQLAAVFGVMAATPRHTYQILTKRSDRMSEWFRWVAVRENQGRAMFPDDDPDWRIGQMLAAALSRHAGIDGRVPGSAATGWEDFDPRRRPWPLPNVWLGVSVENQAAAAERIPHLLATPAAVRFISAEPLLGPVNLRHLDADAAGHASWCQIDALTGRQTHMGRPFRDVGARLDWVIAGAESGTGARPCDVAWLRSLRDQCKAAAVPFFLKQAVDPGGPAFGEPVITAGPGSKRKGRGLIGAPYLDGRQHLEMPEAGR